ncbi:hypothetical protein [Modestobacter altitudinis]|uniref:hypothetical protein n=1 Tax=Modestobacter altitudinis TaxID=2213158 RepID=UPI00110CB0BE|nr:hypothetical protein [Modestobacter altitudinis]
MNPDLTRLERQLRDTLTRTAESVPDSPRPTFSWERPAGTQVVSLADRRPSRSRRVLQVATPLTIAAAVAGVAVLAGQGPSADAPAPELAEVALLAPGGTVPMAPGQYLYSKITYEVESKHGPMTAVDEYWVPQDATDVWTYRASAYDPVTAELVPRFYDPATGAPVEEPHVETAPCGHFAHPEEPCTDAGSWDSPTPRFIANLPTDPAALDALLVEWGDTWTQLAQGADYPVLSTSALDQEYGKLHEPMYAASSLAGATVGMSQPFSQALEQAVAALPGVVAKPATNLDGVPGTSYVAVASDGTVVSDELIFDADGNYIGDANSTVNVAAADESGVAPAE